MGWRNTRAIVAAPAEWKWSIGQIGNVVDLLETSKAVGKLLVKKETDAAIQLEWELGEAIDDALGMTAGPHYLTGESKVVLKAQQQPGFRIGCGGENVRPRCPADHESDLDAYAIFGLWQDSGFDDNMTLHCDGCGRAHKIAVWDQTEPYIPMQCPAQHRAPEPAEVVYGRWQEKGFPAGEKYSCPSCNRFYPLSEWTLVGFDWPRGQNGELHFMPKYNQVYIVSRLMIEAFGHISSTDSPLLRSIAEALVISRLQLASLIS